MKRCHLYLVIALLLIAGGTAWAVSNGNRLKEEISKWQDVARHVVTERDQLRRDSIAAARALAALDDSLLASRQESARHAAKARALATAQAAQDSIFRNRLAAASSAALDSLLLVHRPVLGDSLLLVIQTTLAAKDEAILACDATLSTCSERAAAAESTAVELEEQVVTLGAIRETITAQYAGCSLALGNCQALADSVLAFKPQPYLSLPEIGLKSGIPFLIGAALGYVVRGGGPACNARQSERYLVVSPLTFPLRLP